jgi:microsomal epoxide hydrolase
MSEQYDIIPNGAPSEPTPFTISIPETQLTEFRTLLKLSKTPPPTFESLNTDSKYGITHKWLAEAKDHWLNKFNWQLSGLPTSKCSI